MRKYVIVGASILLMVFVYFYFTLGGFNEPELTLTNSPEYLVAGKVYKGKLNDKAFGKLFDEAEAFIQENNLDANACAIYYNDAQKGSDLADAFVGLLLKDSLSNVPEGYELRKMESRKVIEAKILSHFTVAPINIYEKIAEFAANKQVENLKAPTLEIYPSGKEVIIQVPVK